MNLDVTGDTPFQGVSLRFTANNTAAKVFSSVTFSATDVLKVGLYLPDTISGAVTIAANATDGGGHCIGHGEVVIANVTPGVLGPATSLMVIHTTDCGGGGPVDAGGNDTGGGTGGMNGSGGVTGGTGGVSGGTGGMNTGTGGMNTGTGGMNAGTGGAGGQPSGNLIVNGDFSQGENSWGFPAMSGTISHNANNGQLCITLAGGASVTVGYPSGATPPFQITSGVSYLFSYQASVNGGTVSFEAKVGQTASPFDAMNSDWLNEPLNGTLQTRTHTFSRNTTEPSMGVAFNITQPAGNPTVCIDNVSLMAN